MDIVIRKETPEDYEAVYQIHRCAFGNREDESLLVQRIRRSEQFVPELSLVAELEGAVVGHLLISKAEVVDEETTHKVLALAPIGVLPEFQKAGVGKRLMEEGLARSRKLEAKLICLIGHPAYYPKFGFRPAGKFGLVLRQFEVPEDVFMVCELQEGALLTIKGELKYPAAFFPDGGGSYE